VSERRVLIRLRLQSYPIGVCRDGGQTPGLHLPLGEGEGRVFLPGTAPKQAAGSFRRTAEDFWTPAAAGLTACFSGARARPGPRDQGNSVGFSSEWGESFYPGKPRRGMNTCLPGAWNPGVWNPLYRPDQCVVWA